MGNRKRSFLERDEWIDLTRSDPYLKKPSQHDLMDLLVFIPGLMEDSDRLKESDSPKRPSHQCRLEPLQRNLIQVLADVFLWRWRWERAYPDTVYEVRVDPLRSMTVGPTGESPFQTCLFYGSSHVGGHAIVLYNMVILQLMALALTCGIDDLPLCALQHLPEDSRPASRGPLTLPHEDLSSSDVSEELCRSVEFLLQGPRATDGALNLLLPLRSVLTFGQDARIVAFLVNTLDRMSRLCGFGFSRRLSDMKAITTNPKWAQGKPSKTRAG